MKNLKMMTLSLLLVLFTTQVPQMQAADKNCHLPVYQDVISEITLGYNGALLQGDIKLTNGAILHIVDYKTRDDNVMSKWQAGDVVVFSPHIQKEKLILAIKRVIRGDVNNQVEPYVVFDVINSAKTMLTITEVTDKGKFVKLSDGSVWEFGFFNTYSTEDWCPGQRVLVSGLGDKNSYSFINLDVPLKYNVCTATGTFVVK